MTIEDFARLDIPETEDYELVDSELVRLEPQTPRHAQVCFKIQRTLANYFDHHRTGEAFGWVNCKLSPRTVRRPDVSVFLEERLRQIDLNASPVPFAPDIAIEVLATHDLQVDVTRRSNDFLKSGCQEVWILDELNGIALVRTEATLQLLQREDLIETKLLPGLRVPVSELLS